jgi:hypothetical protein
MTRTPDEVLGRLAQLVEHIVYTDRVGGSSPSPPTIFKSLRDLKQHIVLLSKAQVSGVIAAAKKEVARQQSMSPRRRPLDEIRREWGFRFWRPSGPFLAPADMV